MKFNINFGSETSAGAVKEHNTDSVVDFPITNGHVFVVSDGHDGVEYGGALAANITTEEVKRYFYEKNYNNLANALTNAVSYVNYCVYNQSIKERRYNGIGATLAILLIQNNEAYYASAGNSRIYISKGGQIAQLTRDHVDGDNVTVLVGREKTIKFSVCKNPIQIEGDEHFLICTDGLTSQVSDDEILSVLNNNDMSVGFMAAQLVEKANNAGGIDNTSVQVVDFSPIVKRQEPRGSIWKLVAIVSTLLLVIIVFFEVYKNKVNEGIAPKREVVEQTKPTDVEVSTTHSVPESAEQSTPIATENAIVANSQQTAEATIEANLMQQAKVAQTNEPVIHLHVVEKGQNLFRIGIRYNVPFAKLEELNGQNATQLTIGAKLKIPVKAIHTIRNGETIASIAQAYKSTENDIVKANQLTDGQVLEVGDELIIPLSKK